MLFFCFCFLFILSIRFCLGSLMSKTQRVRVPKETNLKTQHNEPRIMLCFLPFSLLWFLLSFCFLHFTVATPHIPYTIGSVLFFFTSLENIRKYFTFYNYAICFNIVKAPYFLFVFSFYDGFSFFVFMLLERLYFLFFFSTPFSLKVLNEFCLYF